MEGRHALETIGELRLGRDDHHDDIWNLLFPGYGRCWAPKQTGREWPSNVLMHSDARYSSGQPEADPRMSRDGVSEDSEASAGRMKRGPTRTHGERR